MASQKFHCSLVTPEARVFDKEATSVVLPLHDGSAGILPGRAPFVAQLGLGEFRVTFAEGGSHSYFIEDGFVQMVGDKLTLLAQNAVSVEQISQNEAEAELAEASARNPQTAAEMNQVGRDRARARAKADIARRFQAAGRGL